ncbi:hypothetical protein [Rhodococcus opacus]|uniref:Uncharacterized protein n=1 Tax=Rhodococcus opacus (strain B4) TaxID=632772 RepID=C1BCG2_RHOOB|nr:hypothetical protein [Rhodococcus opacus]BAH56017.1 hypothetical protein ROP_pROB01-05180 [Rhodococcus opacus B4]
MRLDLSAPRIGFDGWVFVARLVEEEAGYVSFCAPGQNLDGWSRPDTPHCDYCGKFRRRAMLYVLRHTDTGEIKQVGASCITLFLGVKVAGLWTLEFDLDEHLPTLGGEEWGEPVTRGDRSLHKLDTIAVALASPRAGAATSPAPGPATSRSARPQTPSRPRCGDCSSSATRSCAANSQKG